MLHEVCKFLASIQIQSGSGYWNNNMVWPVKNVLDPTWLNNFGSDQWPDLDPQQNIFIDIWYSAILF